MVDYADYNPAGATRTSKTGRIRPIPQLPNYFNQKWFKDFMSDFQWKNVLENNGVISGCVISDGGSDSLDCTAGEVYINGTKYTIPAPANFPATADGWYVAYAKTDLSVVYGYMENEDVQGALTPDDSVLLGFAVKGDAAFFVNSYFNNIAEFIGIVDGKMDKSQNLDDVVDKANSRTNLDVYSKSEVDTSKLAVTQNLNDLDDKADSRTNLDVYSKSETGTEISNDISTHAAVASTHSVSGDIVGENDIQTLTNKTIEGDNNTITEVDSVKDQGGVVTGGLKCKILEIGDWDMVAGYSVQVVHGMDVTKIRSVSALIRNDQDSLYYAAGQGGTSSPTDAFWIFQAGSTWVELRTTGGTTFDSTNFDSTSYNRGWITIWYDDA